MRNFDSLSEREILALAVSLEEEDERVYADFAEGLRQERSHEDRAEELEKPSFGPTSNTARMRPTAACLCSRSFNPA